MRTRDAEVCGVNIWWIRVGFGRVPRGFSYRKDTNRLDSFLGKSKENFLSNVGLV